MRRSGRHHEFFMYVPILVKCPLSVVLVYFFDFEHHSVCWICDCFFPKAHMFLGYRQVLQLLAVKCFNYALGLVFEFRF